MAAAQIQRFVFDVLSVVLGRWLVFLGALLLLFWMCYCCFVVVFLLCIFVFFSALLLSFCYGCLCFFACAVWVLFFYHFCCYFVRCIRRVVSAFFDRSIAFGMRLFDALGLVCWFPSRSVFFCVVSVVVVVLVADLLLFFVFACCAVFSAVLFLPSLAG